MIIKILGTGCAKCKATEEVVKTIAKELNLSPLIQKVENMEETMYANATGIIPIIQVFVDKGIPLGTSLAFMMAVVGLSIPEATLLKKVMSIKLIFIFFGVVTVCIIFSGYIFNILL